MADPPERRENECRPDLELLKDTLRLTSVVCKEEKLPGKLIFSLPALHQWLLLYIAARPTQVNEPLFSRMLGSCISSHA